MQSFRSLWLFLGLMVVAAIAAGGCGKEKRAATEKTGEAADGEYAAGSMAHTKGPAVENNLKQMGLALHNYHDVYADVSTKTSKAKGPVKAPVERKIIYTANIRVIVKDLDKARQVLDELRTKHKAYVASSDVSGQTGSQRVGTWTIRLPVDQFEALRKALLDLGVPQQNALSSEDITRQYYSLESRMRNAEATEKRLLAHLEKSKETKDTLTIEKELDRVRGTIEEMKGQLQVWQTLTALTTVNLTLIEDKNYQPEQAPTFATRISETFGGSLDALGAFGRGLTLFFVALTPWLPVLAVVVVPMWWYVRRSRRRAAKQETL